MEGKALEDSPLTPSLRNYGQSMVVIFFSGVATKQLPMFQ